MTILNMVQVTILKHKEVVRRLTPLHFVDNRCNNNLDGTIGYLGPDTVNACCDQRLKLFKMAELVTVDMMHIA